MTKNILFLFLIITTFSCCKSLKKPNSKDVNKFFKHRDLNNDDILTEAEFIKYHKKIFKEIDLDGNHKISQSEAKKVNKEQVFNMFKKNEISYFETLEKEDERFIEIDLNKNGKVGKEEYRKYYLKNLGTKKALFD